MNGIERKNGKMKVFQFNKKFLTLVGFYPFDRIKKPYAKFIQALTIYTILISLGAFTILNATYIYQHSTDFSQIQDAIISFITAFTLSGTIGSFICFNMNKGKWENLTKSLQDTVDRGKKK